MKRTRLFSLIAVFAIIASGIYTAPAGAATVFTWWLARREDKALLCAIDVTHEGSPTADEIEAQCGHDLRVEWENTPPCLDESGVSCTGLTLNLASTQDLITAAASSTFPPIFETPISSPILTPAPDRSVHWLSRTDSVEELASNRPLAFLAGHLIANRIVDINECPDIGLLTNGAASTCGLEKARYQVYLWQNRFDTNIFNAAQETGVPPYLLKGVFTQETQFWPAASQNNSWDFGEYGLGQLNELGADALLAWNASFYNKFCPTVLEKKNCKKEYISLPADQRALLRGAAINLVRADCPTCAYGIDIPKAESSVLVFAEILRANNAQVHQVIRNATGWYTATFGVSSEDMWRFTLVNYHAGPGCLYSALGATRLAGEKLTWKNVSQRLEPGCEDAVDYVESISDVSVSVAPPPAPTATSLPPTSTSLPTETPAEVWTPTATATLPVGDTATATEATLTPTETATPALEVSPTVGIPAETTPTATSIAAETPAEIWTLTATTTLPVSNTATATQIVSHTATATSAAIETATPTLEVSPTAGIPAEATPTAASLMTETPTESWTPTATVTLPVNDTATATLIATETAMPTATLPLATQTSSPTPASVPVDVQSPHAAGEIIVQVGPGSGSDIEAIVDLLSVPVQVKPNESLPELNAVLIEVAPADLQQALAELQDHPDVASAEPNYIARAAYIPNDPSFSQQSSLAFIQVPMAWDLITSAQEVTVAVIDTGVDVSHPDLSANLWQNAAEASGLSGVDDDSNGYVDDVWGWNMAAGNNDVQDDHGHGTHLAGVIAAVSDNGAGVAGIAPNARIMTVKALDASGFGTYAQVADAIIYAADQGARIINLSFGGAGHSQVLQDAINYALGRGVIVVAAAGNTGMDAPVYPAAYPGVISASAVDNGLTWTTFSSFGSATTVTAPGIDIYSTWLGGNYSQMSGTSVSSAEVSGVAALLAGQSQFSNSIFIRNALVNTAFDLGASGWDPYYGFGLVHAYDGLLFTETGMPPVVWPTLGPSPTPDSDSSGVWALATQNLWGTAQSVANCTLANAANSIDLAFNNAVATCAGNFGTGNWTYTAVQDTTLTSVVSATLEYRFYITGWVDDRIDLEVSNNNGANWTRIARFQTGSPPPTVLTTLSYNVTTNYTTPAQANNARFRLRGTQVNGGTDTITIYLDEARLIVSDVIPTPTAFPPQPTPTLPARAATAIPGVSDPHVDYTATSDDCAGCHRSHTATGIVLRWTWPEEQVCFTCHTAGGTGTNIQPAFTLYTNTATSIFKHDAAGTNGVHRVGQNSGVSFSGLNRHIECEDCHEPHESTRDSVAGTTIPPMIQPEMYYTSGVNPTWTGPGAPSAFVWMDQAQREFQVCFKCHSTFTTLPTYQPDGWNGAVIAANGLRKLTSVNASQILDSRDLAQEFNPNHASFHPVIAQGRNTVIPAGGFVPSWSANSMVYCSDCHTNASQPTNGYGPHGSPRLHILFGANEYSTVDSNRVNLLGDGEICFRCHKKTTYAPTSNMESVNTRFHNGTMNLHELHSGGPNGESAPCYVCHDSHGSEQQRLINFDTATVTINAGYTSQSAWVWNGTTGTCFIACHGTSHNAGKSYTP
ncbi:MAG: S8 family serine peptidase [Chloroflexi bacterium]|nr:S8 family serine peptidase [Chloroflexota bacterium]